MAPAFTDRLQAAAERLGFPLRDGEVDVMAEVARALLDDLERIDALPDELLPAPAPGARDGGAPPRPEENPVHGWVWRCRVEGAADGPLAGWTVGLKDTIALAGAPLLNGSTVMEGFVPTQDATVVTRLLDAGATIVGKTAVPAFCFEGAGLIGHPHPLPVNPFDRERLPGASSSGSAAVVAAGEVDLALGGDQGGSIRIPASWCGCVGHKPTFGLVPYTGVFPVEVTLDHVGPMARTVAACAQALDALAGADGLDPRQAGVEPAAPAAARLRDGVAGLRVGVLAEGFGCPGAEPEVERAVRDAIARLERDGARVEPVSVPAHRDGMALWNAICLQGATAMLLDGEAVGTNSRGHHWTELGDFYREARRRRAAQLPDTLKVTLLAGTLLAERRGVHYYAKAQNLGRALRRDYDAALERCDVLVMPTTPMRAPRLPEGGSPGELLLQTIGLESAANVAPFDVTGHPALSVPCQREGELPCGLMVVGRHGDDATVLRCGQAVEDGLRAVAGTTN
ncbi:amidase [Conexibacter arvalis]|uniref:Amidase n=1 Tax=Conexibacter arvalis TaxID=912552 RepID=A0A840IDK0_9ACTN|nr:amidase [Conexibacter arvalis]MBB4662020.1 amidase [Conexibacter arvalis]